MSKVIGITDLLNKEYDTYTLDETWIKHLGVPEKGFTMNISGFSANGKTNFTILVTKAFAKLTRVDYNSFEEGHESTMQVVSKRHNLKEVAGKIMFLNRFTFNELDERLSKRNSSKIVVIDSGDDMELTYKQFLTLKAKYPKKSFIIVSKGNDKTGEPISTQQKKIKFKCPIKVVVKNFVATIDSRYGGNEKFIIRHVEPVVGDQLTLLK